MYSCLSINKTFGRIRNKVGVLLSMYEDNIKKKFLMLYQKLLASNRKPFDKSFDKFEEMIGSYRIGFSDFRLHTYIFNLHTIYEQYFPLWKIIDYRSKLELE